MAADMQHDPQPQLLNKQDLCSRLTISIRTIENMVKAGSFPPPVRIGKCVYWSNVAVSKWQRQLFAAQENWEGGVSRILAAPTKGTLKV